MANDNLTLGRGTIDLANFRAGTFNPESWRYIGHTTEASLSATSEKLDHWNMDSKIKFKDKSVTLSNEINGTFTTDNISPENIGMFFFSDGQEKITRTAGTGLTYNVDDIVFNRKYLITDDDGNGIQDVRNVTVSIGGAALEVEIDYQVDQLNGTVMFIEGGAATLGADAVITYNIVSSRFTRVISGETEVACALRFVSDNASGENYTIFIPYALISPNGDYQLKGDEWQTVSFNFSVMKLPGRAAIYRDSRPVDL